MTEDTNTSAPAKKNSKRKAKKNKLTAAQKAGKTRSKRVAATKIDKQLHLQQRTANKIFLDVLSNIDSLREENLKSLQKIIATKLAALKAIKKASINALK